MKKQCSVCKIFKLTNQFHICKKRKDGIEYKCKKCKSEYNSNFYTGNIKHIEKTKEYNKRNQRKVRNCDLLRDFGITIDEYEKMLTNQNNKCKICNKEETVKNKKTNKLRMLCVDHCHKTGKIRGLLCNRCNSAIGLLYEDSTIINNCLKYLEI